MTAPRPTQHPASNSEGRKRDVCGVGGPREATSDCVRPAGHGGDHLDDSDGYWPIADHPRFTAPVAGGDVAAAVEAHSLRVFFDRDVICAEVVCNATPDDDCRLSCDEGCEEWGAITRDGDGIWHYVDDDGTGHWQDKGHRMHVVDYCNVCEFINGDGAAEFGSGTFDIATIPIKPQWEGDYYSWSAALSTAAPDPAPVADGEGLTEDERERQIRRELVKRAGLTADETVVLEAAKWVAQIERDAARCESPTGRPSRPATAGTPFRGRMAATS